MSTKQKKNSGFNNLRDLDIQNISDGANLKENFSSRKSDKNLSSEVNKTVIKSLEIPREFDSIIRDAKKNKKIIGSINAYIIEALRRRMVDENLI
jgi:hypothetical protein